MSREIKFRAWDKETKEMSNDFLSKNWLKVCVESPYVELMQYTGLKDKNGIEIYEGDIVTEHHAGLAFEPDFYQTQEVKWDTFGFMPFQRVIGGKMHDYANNLKEFIVVGNIYENPELLESTSL